MKKLILIGLFGLFLLNINAQSITGVTISPANPTPTDTIYFYVDLIFPNSGCPLMNSGSSLQGNTIIANTMHCQGMLAMICNATDTFMQTPLPIGNYSFDITLNSGMGPIPCTPGIVPNDNRVENFTVSIPTEINELTIKEVTIAPNPSNGFFKLNYLVNANVIVYDVLGNELMNKSRLNGEQTLDLTEYPKGIYLLKIINNGVAKTHRLLKK